MVNEMKHNQFCRWMKKSGAALTVFGALALGVLSASAAPTVYEPFNYGSLPNNTASTGLGETGNWTNGTTPSMVASLTYPNLTTTNNALSTTGGRMFVNLSQWHSVV
jgi:hypothetical protein